MKNNYIKRFLTYHKNNWTISVICIINIILINIGKSEIHFEWIKDINIWLNEIAGQLFMFLFMYIISNKLKNELLQILISFIMTLIISKIVVNDFSNVKLTWVTTSFLLLLIIYSMVYNFWGYNVRLKKGEEKIIKENYKYISLVKVVPNELNTKIFNAHRLIKKNRELCEIIQDFGITNIEEYICIRKNRNNKI